MSDDHEDDVERVKLLSLGEFIEKSQREYGVRLPAHAFGLLIG